MSCTRVCACACACAPGVVSRADVVSTSMFWLVVCICVCLSVCGCIGVLSELVGGGLPEAGGDGVIPAWLVTPPRLVAFGAALLVGGALLTMAGAGVVLSHRNGLDVAGEELLVAPTVEELKVVTIMEVTEVETVVEYVRFLLQSRSDQPASHLHSAARPEQRPCPEQLTSSLHRAEHLHANAFRPQGPEPPALLVLQTRATVWLSHAAPNWPQLLALAASSTTASVTRAATTPPRAMAVTRAATTPPRPMAVKGPFMAAGSN